MIGSKRHGTNKHKSARTFNKASGKTHPKNVAGPPMRGGWRL